MGDVLLRLSLHHSPYTPPLSPITNPPRLNPSRKLGLQAASIPSTHHPKPLSNFKIHAVAAENDEPKWWEKNAGLNMIDVHSTKDVLNALIEAGDKLVIVEFYGTWCGSCRALFPKICKTAKEHPDIIFIKVNFDENKSMCKRLNVKVLPYFQFYRGADGLLESFSCSLAKFQKIKDAIAMHNTARCSIVPLLGVRDPTLLETSTSQENPAEPSPSSPNLSR